MDYFGHNPPHVHAEYGGHEVTVTIRYPPVVKGRFPAAKKKVLIQWVEEYEEELMARWGKASRGHPIGPIEP